MAIEFKLPDIGEGLADGEIIKWLVSEGDQVEEDQPLVEVLTDKATVEIPSPHDGRILKLCAGEGDVVAIGAAILLFAESDDESAEDFAADVEEILDEQPIQAYEGEAVEILDEQPIQAYEGEAAEILDEQPIQAYEGETTEILDEQATQASEDIELARELARAERSAVEAELDDDEVQPEIPAPPVPPDGRILATPATRRLANELGIDIALVSGSGLDGRVMKEDVRAFAEGELPEVPDVPDVPATATEPLSMDEPDVPEDAVEAGPAAPPSDEAAGDEDVEATPDDALPVPAVVEPPPADEVDEPPLEEPLPAPAAVEPLPVDEVVEAPVVAPAPPPPAIEPPAAVESSTSPAGAAAGAEERIPLRGLRRKISERMVVAKQTAPHYTYVEEADMEEVVLLRAEAKAMAAEHGVKLTYLPFIVRALTMALKKHPYLNASLDQEAGEVVLKGYYNIGIAAATEGGLIVPVIRNADALGLFELASEIQRLSNAARDGSIVLEDLQGGTFTITSTGNIGGLIATPILNLPEVAILGVTAIRKRPVVRNDQIVIRHMVNLSLTLDHRVVDGAVGALFMRDLVKLLEDPKLQLLANL